MASPGNGIQVPAPSEEAFPHVRSDGNGMTWSLGPAHLLWAQRSNPGVLGRVNHWNWSSIGSRNSISKTKSTDKNLRRNVKWGMWEKQAPHLHELTDWLQVQFSPSILWAPFTQRWAFTTANASNVEFFTTVIYKNIYYKCWGFIKLSNVIRCTKHNVQVLSRFYWTVGCLWLESVLLLVKCSDCGVTNVLGEKL